MKLDCVKCNKCGKIHSVSKGCEPLTDHAVLGEVRTVTNEILKRISEDKNKLKTIKGQTVILDTLC